MVSAADVALTLCVVDAAGKPTIDELSKRKWLRHVDFISVASKLEHHHSSSNAHMRRLLYNSLMWKLAAFFLADWLDNAHALGGAVPAASTTEDEDVRQRQKVSAAERR